MKSVCDVLHGQTPNALYPFLWVHGVESEEELRREVQKIRESGIGGFCVEARPHKDFNGPGWFRDLALLPTEGRPLSQGADLAAMWQRRAPLYARFRDAEADNNGTAEETAAAIWRDFCVHCGSERPEFEHAGHPAAGDLRT